MPGFRSWFRRQEARLRSSKAVAQVLDVSVAGRSRAGTVGGGL